ncbi:MAG: hypothetical protein AUG06_01515 [Actinobacteria bacterium 13_1_20CM_2_65_11]|nr:MAG: hypothetical protein AUJ02_06195 [Chloroflexi bacterium 13_1_40CM_3_65_12]OLE81387.1 MAG: hypothetical protein AUG06_01515 [Actinobacteria bacterium 13_1_20CM_2_65_11]
MELRHLRAFVAIAEHRHYGRAAASIRMTQPAITHRIHVLEAELGVRLLERNAREVRLTPAGEVLIEHARGLVQIEERALGALRDHAAGIIGRLNISYLTLWDVGLPAEILAEYRRRYPAVKLELTSGYSQTNVERLLAGDVDFAFVGVAIGEHNGIAIRPLDRHELVLVMSPAHRFMEMESVPIDCLRGEPVITVSSGVNGPLAAASISWLTKYIGEPPNVVGEEPPDQMAAALAQARNAVSLMSEHRAAIARADGLDYRRLTPKPLIEYGAAWVRDNPSPALANLLQTVDDIAPPLPADVPAGSELIWVRPAPAAARR